MNHKLLALLPVLVLAACGGADPGPLPQPKSPVIVNPGQVTVQEFTGLVTKLDVTSPDKNVVKLSLSGPDAALFAITDDGTLRFSVPPDFLAPADSGKDNTYNVTVVANDTYSTPASLSLAIKVTECSSCRVATTSARVTTDATTFVPENIIASFEFPGQVQQQTTKYTLTGAFATTTNWNNLEFANANLAPLAARIGNAR